MLPGIVAWCTLLHRIAIFVNVAVQFDVDQSMPQPFTVLFFLHLKSRSVLDENEGRISVVTVDRRPLSMSVTRVAQPAVLPIGVPKYVDIFFYQLPEKHSSPDG